MNSTSSARFVLLLASALTAGAFVGLNTVKVDPAALFQMASGATAVIGLLAIARQDYAPRRGYDSPSTPAPLVENAPQTMSTAPKPAQSVLLCRHTISA